MRVEHRVFAVNLSKIDYKDFRTSYFENSESDESTQAVSTALQLSSSWEHFLKKIPMSLYFYYRDETWFLVQYCEDFEKGDWRIFNLLNVREALTYHSSMWLFYAKR